MFDTICLVTEVLTGINFSLIREKLVGRRSEDPFVGLLGSQTETVILLWCISADKQSLTGP